MIFGFILYAWYAKIYMNGMPEIKFINGNKMVFAKPYTGKENHGYGY